MSQKEFIPAYPCPPPAPTRRPSTEDLRAVIDMAHAYGLMRGALTGMVLGQSTENKARITALLDEADASWNKGQQHFNQV